MSIWQQPNVQVECLFQDRLKNAKSGNDDDVSYLYNHFHKWVFGYIFNRVKDSHTAEDLTSAVFVRMVENIQKVRTNNEVGFRAWLLKVADRAIAQHFACEKIKCVSLEETLEYPCVTEKYSAVTEAFNALTEEQKQAIDGMVILGRGAEEVGIMMGGKKPGTVRRLRFRGLNTMQRILVATVIILIFLFGITIRLIQTSTPSSPLYHIKLLGERIVPFQQEKKPQIQPAPYQNQRSAPLSSIAPVTLTPTATSTPVSTSSAVVQPSPIPATPTSTPIETPGKETIICINRICL